MNILPQEIIPIQTADSVTVPKRAKRADAIANRKLILCTAQRLIAQHGVANVCMAAVSEAAGVGKGTLYRSFANKGELCHALLDEDMRHFQDEILAMFRREYNQPALVRLDKFLDQFVHFMEFHAPLLNEVQNQGNLDVSEIIHHSSPQVWLPWLRNSIGLLLEQAMRREEANNLDIPYLVDAILAPLNARLFMYQREVLGFELERISRSLRRLVFYGCGLLEVEDTGQGD